MSDDEPQPFDPPEEDAGFPSEALDILQDVLTSFASDMTSAELEGAREFLLDMMAAHPLGHLLSERLRERPSSAHTEERDANGVGAAAKDSQNSKKAGGAD
ncbi:MAG: hypothetical protein U0414_25490 [Polyangiaceae bacterium]